MKDVLLALAMAAALAVGFFYEPPANANVSLIHVEQVHVVEPWENAEEIAKQYLPFNKEYNSVKSYAVAIRRANDFKALAPGTKIIIPLAYERK